MEHQHMNRARHDAGLKTIEEKKKSKMNNSKLAKKKQK